MAISTVSINNTPQANGDTFTKTEDQVSGIYCFDVMSNDLGGNAKILWSLDDTATDGTSDLIASDIGETVTSTDDTSLNGARIWIENGKVRYDTSSLNSSFLANIGALAAGETLTDSFTYAIRMANGTLAWTTATIIYQGENDGVTVTSAPHNGSLTEDAAASIGGSIAFTDPDASDTHTASVTGTPASTLGTFTLGSVSEAPGAANGSVGWTYEVDNAAAQYLAVGESATESYTITIVDNHGSSTTTTVTVTVTGLNDGVSITSGAQSGSLDEDAGASLGGTISFTDVDLSDGHTAGFTGPGVLGTFVLGSVSEAANAANGSVGWTYQVNNAAAQYLAQGESAVETYVVTVSDGNGATATQNVEVTVTGSNDGVSITTADDSGSLSEDAAASIGGSIAFTDVDLSDEHSAGFSGPSGALGTFQLGSVSEAANASNGSVGWTYEVDNAAAQYLAAGESVVETYIVTVTDDFGETATQNVAVTITGLNDGVSIGGGALAGNVVEDSADYQEVGSFVFGDVDSTDTHTVSIAPDGLGYLGSLNALVTNDSTGDGAGQVNWRFQVDNAALQYLGEGETLIQSYTLTVDDGEGGGATQTVTVTLTGDNDGVSITSADDDGSLTEDAGASIGGSIAFTDVDLSDSHTADFTGPSGLGTFQLGSVNEAAGAAGGSVGWTYEVDSAAAQYLAAGKSVVETYTVTITDDFGETATQTVEVTITGNNDDVLVTAGGAVDGDVTEDTLPTRASGSFGFTDVDLSDTHSVSVAADGSGYLGTLNAIVSDDSTGDGTGSVNWRFNVDNAALQYLGDGQTLVQTYTVTVDDGEGSTATETVSITLTGVNDEVLVTAGGAVDGDVTEDTLPTRATGSFAFTDVDLSDTHSVNVAADGSGYLGSLNAIVSDDSTGDGSGQINWRFNVDNADLQYLGEGETVIQTYTVTVDDGEGSTATETVSITITGVNDAAEITGDANGSVLEDSAPGTDTGNLDSTDVDNADDAWTVSSGDAAYGSYAIDADGVWTYTLDNANGDVDALNVGDSLSDMFTVTTVDGTSQTVTVIINGANDAAVIGGVDTGEVTEATASLPGDPDASGTLESDDVDNPDNAFTASAGDASYGAFEIDANGFWTYTLDNSDAAVEALNDGDSLIDTFVVSSVDGTTHTVSVQINGANDVAPITANRDVIVVSTGTTVFIPAAWLLANDTDADNDTLTITSMGAMTALPTGWSLTPVMSGGVVTGFNLTTGNNTNISLDIGYTITDGDGNTSTVVSTVRTPAAGNQSTPGANTITLNGIEYNYSYIDGQAQGDTITGGSTTPITLEGTVGNDAFVGSAGNDVLDAGGGHNLLTGGGDNDDFIFRNFSGMTNHITDFNAGTSSTTIDQIFFDVGVGANMFSVGDNDTVIEAGELFINTGTSFANAAAVQAYIDAQSGSQGALFVVFNADLGNAAVYYDSDPNTDGGAVLVTEIDNVTTLAGISNFNSGDFIFA